MRTIYIIAILLQSMVCTAQQYIPKIKVDYGFSLRSDKTLINGGFEYTYLRDISKYYSAKLFGYTTGIYYVDNDRIQVPVYWTMKRNEWNDVFNAGVILDNRIDRLDLYASWGHDHLFKRHLTDGWIWTLEIYGKYNKYRTELGLRAGFGFVYDKYHYRKWYKNY